MFVAGPVDHHLCLHLEAQMTSRRHSAQQVGVHSAHQLPVVIAGSIRFVAPLASVAGVGELSL